LSAKLINALAAIPLIEMMIAFGLGWTLSAVVKPLKPARLVGRTLLAYCVLVPCLAVALHLAVDALSMVAAGMASTAATTSATAYVLFQTALMAGVAFTCG
jgi:predicted Na+-dependent transporter